MLSAHHGRSRHPVIEVDGVIDFDNEGAVGQDLDRLIAGCGSRAVIIDVTMPLVTSAALHVLVRARRRADTLGVVLCVIARRPSARKVFRLTGLHRTLRVAATLSGAEALCRRCAPGPAVTAAPVLPGHLDPRLTPEQVAERVAARVRATRPGPRGSAATS